MPHLETMIAHAGCEPDPSTGAIVSPIHVSTTFEREADGSYPKGYIYSRSENPNRNQLEATLAQLEGGAMGLAFASGMAASTAIIQVLRPGDHVILADDVYYGMRRLMQTLFVPWGLRVSSADLTNLEQLEAAFTPNTRLVWAETPSNPLLKITDLATVAACAHAHDALLAVDNTWATPLLQRPLDLGADIVMHSLTKYIAGHSDVLGGGVVVKENDAFAEQLKSIQIESGPVLDPFSSWLTLRGLRSLSARLRVQCENASRLATFLEGHPSVARVHFPGLISHTGHTIAQAQMRDFGGMLSFEVKGSTAEAMQVAANVRVFRRATSLGGTESLIEHRASIEAPPTKTPQALLRISLGLEHPDDLLADLDQALATLG